MTSRWHTLIGLVIALLLIVLNRTVWLGGVAPAYVVVAHLLQTGQFDARVYNDAWYKTQTLALTHGIVSDIFSPSPPTLALFLWLLAWSSSYVWAVLNFCALWLTCALTFYTLTDTPPPRWTFVVVLGVTLLSSPLYENLARGQIYLLLALLHAFVFWGALRAHEAVAGVALGLMFAWKLHAWPLWVMMLCLRQWRVATWGVITIGACVLLTLSLMGTDIWRVYLQQVLPTRAADPSAAVTAYQTLNSFFQHLFRYDATWNPAPLFDAPWLATLSWLVGLGVLLGVTLARAPNLSMIHTLGAGITLSMILAPLAEQYHFLILLVPCIVLAAEWPQLSLRSRLLFLLATALLGSPLPFKHPLLNDGWLALFAYPRLYGDLLLWGLLVFSISPHTHATVNHSLFTFANEGRLPKSQNP
jgi:hypothetical protein